MLNLTKIPLGRKKYLVCWQDTAGNCYHRLIGLTVKVYADNGLPFGTYIDTVLSELTNRVYP
jgi:hypothetical protein